MLVPAVALVLFAQLVPSHGSGSAASSSSSPNAAGGLTWTVPKAWTLAPKASSMRVATHKVPAAPGDPEDGELAIFYFGEGQGGGVDANVERWFAQLEPEPGASKNEKKETRVGGIKVTVVAASGTYSSGMPGGPTTPKKGWALRGAIAEGPKGAVFFKLTGPKKTVAAAAGDFDALVKSLKKAP